VPKRAVRETKKIGAVRDGTWGTTQTQHFEINQCEEAQRFMKRREQYHVIIGE
jgi:hypothetical protein